MANGSGAILLPFHLPVILLGQDNGVTRNF